MNHQGAKGTKVDMIMSQISGPDELTDRIAHQVIGAAIEVHRELGPGYLESVYEEALCHELALQKMTFRRPKFDGGETKKLQKDEVNFLKC